jgi:hypothetical protein
MSVDRSSFVIHDVEDRSHNSVSLDYLVSNNTFFSFSSCLYPRPRGSDMRVNYRLLERNRFTTSDTAEKRFKSQRREEEVGSGKSKSLNI